MANNHAANRTPGIARTAVKIENIAFQVRYFTLATTEMINAAIAKGNPMNSVSPGTSSESQRTSMIRNIANVKTIIGPNSEANESVNAVADNNSFSATNWSFKTFC